MIAVMNPIIESHIILDDETVRSCEPNSLKAVLDAFYYMSYKVNGRVKIHTVNVRYLETPEPDKDNPKMLNAKYQVNIGFYIKDEWYNAQIVMHYYYAPGACASLRDESVAFKKQVDGELIPFSFSKGVEYDGYDKT